MYRIVHTAYMDFGLVLVSGKQPQRGAALLIDFLFFVAWLSKLVAYLFCMAYSIKQ